MPMWTGVDVVVGMAEMSILAYLADGNVAVGSPQLCLVTRGSF